MLTQVLNGGEAKPRLTNNSRQVEGMGPPYQHCDAFITHSLGYVPFQPVVHNWSIQRLWYVLACQWENVPCYLSRRVAYVAMAGFLERNMSE